MSILGIIFDLDGVLVSTDEYHYQAWEALAGQEKIPYDRSVNIRQRGVSRMESLEILLENAARAYTPEEKKNMADRKNEIYKKMIRNITPSDLLPGVERFLQDMRQNRLRCAIGSSSRNTMTILKGIGLDHFFDAVADGTKISHSKPDPEVFLLAAALLGLPPENCLVIEDADAGIQAAKAAGMHSLAVGAAQDNPAADFRADTLASITVYELMERL